MSDEIVTEHATEMTGGGMHVRWVGADEVYPLEQWIRAQRRFGGKVYRRRIVVVEDWIEFTE